MRSKNYNKKMRLVWISDRMTMYIPVKDEVEAYKFTCILGAYDSLQEKRNVRKIDMNDAVLETFNEEDNDWFDWGIENEFDYSGSYEDYAFHIGNFDELTEFNRAVYNQED